jgi:hypothetical protein
LSRWNLLRQYLILDYIANADDLLIIQDAEDRLQKSICTLQKTGKDYNIKISVNKTNIMASIGKYLVWIKIIIAAKT